MAKGQSGVRRCFGGGGAHPCTRAKLCLCNADISADVANTMADGIYVGGGGPHPCEPRLCDADISAVMAQIMANGVYVGSLERDGDLAVVLNDAADQVGRANDGKKVDLDILVMQIGRSNFGNSYDLKGLVSGIVLLNSAPPGLTWNTRAL